MSFSPYLIFLGRFAEQSEISFFQLSLFSTKAQMTKKAPTPKTSEGRPRHELMLASLDQAAVQDAGLQALARSIRTGDGDPAL